MAEVVAVLRAAGYDTVEKVLAADPEQLVGLPGFDQETVYAVMAAAKVQAASEDTASSPEAKDTNEESAAD